MGLGGYGNGYVDALLDHGDEMGVELAGAVDPNPSGCRRTEEVAAAVGKIHPDLDAFYASDSADLVVISTPIHLHASTTTTALAHGSSVLCEKPVAGSLADARVMQRALADAQGALPAAGEPGRKSGDVPASAAPRHERGREPSGGAPLLAIGYQWSFSPVIRRMREQIAAGRFGTPLSFRTLVFWPRPRSYYGRNSWAGALRTPGGDAVLDSPVNNATAHYLHNMLFVLPQDHATPQTVTAELYRANEIENYDTAAIRVETAGGTTLHFATAHPVPSQIDPVIHYRFSEADITCTVPGSFFCRFSDGTVEEIGSPESSHHEKLSVFAQAVRERGASPCSLSEAANQLAVVLAAQESAPVQPFPDDLIRTMPLGRSGDELVWVDGLQAALTQCYALGRLPSELGTPWAAPGTPIDARRFALE